MKYIIIHKDKVNKMKHFISSIPGETVEGILSRVKPNKKDSIIIKIEETEDPELQAIIKKTIETNNLIIDDNN